MLEEFEQVLLIELAAIGNGLLAASRDEDKGWERGDAEPVDGGLFLVPDLSHRNDIQEINGDTPQQRTRSSLVREQNRLWLLPILFQKAINLLIRQLGNMVVNLGHHRIDDAARSARALVVLDDGAAGLLSRADNLEGGEALDAHGAAKGLVGLVVAVDGGDFGEAVEVLCGFFVGGLEAFAVAAPGGVEFDDLDVLVVTVT